ncbi:MAG: RIP metalloprotease RseP [Minisyncoccia bacterium]
MSILIFLIIVSALIIVHELGHFLVARKFGIRVDEFGLGFPPRAAKLFTWKNTPFTLNWLPFGGFVKIFGENPNSEEGDTTSSESFVSKNRAIQSAVLIAGVAGNFLFAWALFSLGFMTGIPAPASDFQTENVRTLVTTVLPGSPAGDAGLRSGDAIISISRGETASGLSPEEISLFIAQSEDPLVFGIDRGGEISEKTVVPETGIIGERPAVGISMELIGTAKLPPPEALWQGLKTTSSLTLATASAIGSFIFEALGGKADLSGITGPVGIVGMVGDARELGFGYLLTFTALISINLAVINLLPFPALDGGRLLFVGIEALTRRSIPARVANVANSIGFALLIFLMVLITIQDVRNIF